VKTAIAGLRSNRIALLFARIILGGVFIYASIGKIALPEEFARIVVNYRILPPGVAVYFAFILPWLELILGLFLVAGLFLRETSLALSGLLCVFLAALVIKSIDGTVGNCGCFTVSAIDGSHGPIVVVMRELTLLVLSGFIFWGELARRSLGPARN
jgi:putative oxidoreductase